MIKRLIYEVNRAQDFMIEDINDIYKVFKYLRDDQYELAAKNWVPNLDASEILYINAGGSIMYITLDTMDHIKGEMLWDIFSRM